MSGKPDVLSVVSCWRCRGRRCWYEVEDLEDGLKLGFYECAGCRTAWYDVSDIMPYLVRLRQQIRELAGSNRFCKAKKFQPGCQRRGHHDCGVRLDSRTYSWS